MSEIKNKVLTKEGLEHLWTHIINQTSSKVDKSGGYMTGSLESSSYQRTQKNDISTWNNIAHFNYYQISGNVGTLAIKIKPASMFLLFNLKMAGYNFLWDFNFSGYTYTAADSFHTPLVTGNFTGTITPEVRVAVDSEGYRYILLGNTTTDWGGYIRGSIPQFTAMGAVNAFEGEPVEYIGLITDESGLTSISTVEGVASTYVAALEERIRALEDIINNNTILVASDS
jgi:hypothetical protein